MIRLLQIILFIPYAAAYALAHVLRVKDRENMPTLREWLGGGTC